MRLAFLSFALTGLLLSEVAFAQGAPTGGSSGTSAPPAAAPPAAPAPAATLKPAPPAAPTPPPAAIATPATLPAPAAPAAPPTGGAMLTPTVSPSEPAPPSKKVTPGDINLALPPSVPQFGAQTSISQKEAEALTSSVSNSSDEWKFEFHGYMRAPVRATIGPPSPVNHPARDPNDMNAQTCGMNPCNYVPPFQPGATPPSGYQLHEAPRVPGANYQAWDFTNTLYGPWTQLNFSYGNSRVTTTVVVDAYNQADGSYRNLQANQGIDQVFLTLRFPDAFGDYGGLTWNIGSFPSRYGTAGKYDAGMYETYQFGRTHVSGEVLTATFSNLDPMGDWTLTLEHGIGAKLDFMPFTNNQNYQIFGTPGGPSNPNGAPDLAAQSPDYLPYAGSVPQGSTYLHHAHIFAKYQKMWNFGLHYLFTWTPDDNWDPMNSRLPNVSDAVPRFQGPTQGSMAVLGAEVRFTGGEYGDGYLSYTYIDARNVNALAESLEVLHTKGGPNFKQAYFGSTYNPHTGIYNGPENESGIINSVDFQYSFSFGAYARAPEDWWGDGPDLVVTGFGMFTTVDSKAPPIALGNVPGVSGGDPTRATTWDMSTKKLKFGLDAIYTPLSWLGAGVRFDQVRPDIDGAYSRTTFMTSTQLLRVPGGSDLNFSVLTGRLVMKTQYVTHETVTLQYSRYFLGKAAYPSDYRFAWVPQSDANAVELSAAMWW